MKVSVIIPVYNVEKYIHRCIKSVKEQTYSDLEIILVDDGSTDSSGDICEQYAKDDSRIRVIHKTNGGLSSARNAGMSIATGEYVTFLDSDDYLAKDFVEYSVMICEKNNTDIAIMQMLFIAEGTNEEIIGEGTPKIQVLNSEQAIEESLLQIKYSCCAPSKLYKYEIAKKVQFPIGKLSEDLATCHLFLSHAQTISYSDKIGYYYRQRDLSIMHVFNPKRLDALEWMHDIDDFCTEKYPSLKSSVKCRTFNVAVHLLLDLPSSGSIHDKYYQVIWDEIKSNRLSVIKNNKIRKREKAAAILSFGGERMLRRVWNSRLAAKRKEV